MAETYVVPSFGGGINVAGNPLALQDDEWLWSNGVWPNRGTAEVMVGYSELIDASWMPAGHIPLGLVANPFHGNLLGCSRHDSTTTDTGLVGISRAGVASALSSTGTEPDVDDESEGASGMPVVNGLGYIALGDASASSLLQFTPATVFGSSTFTRVNPSGGLVGRYCDAVAGHLFLAWAGTTSTSRFLNARTVRYAATNDGTDWVASVANDADSVTLDAREEITGLAPITGGMIVTTLNALYIFRSTGGIPAFTVETVLGQGSLGPPLSTPSGVFLNSQDGVYLVGAGRVSDRLGTVLRARYDMLWHPTYRAVLIAAVTGDPTDESFFLDPETGRAWRAQLPSGVQFLRVRSGSSCVVRFSTATPVVGGEAYSYVHAVCDAGAAIYAESQTATDAFSGAYVRSKLFTHGAPPMAMRVHRIKVDWEPLSNATTDAIQVSLVAVDALSATLLGSTDLQLDSYTYTPIGTLTAGASELAVDAHAKYVGFQFTQSSGKARIRGFAFTWSPAGDRIP